MQVFALDVESGAVPHELVSEHENARQCHTAAHQKERRGVLQADFCDREYTRKEPIKDKYPDHFLFTALKVGAIIDDSGKNGKEREEG